MIRREIERTIFSKPASHQFDASCAAVPGEESGNEGDEDTGDGDSLEKKGMSRIGG